MTQNLLWFIRSKSWIPKKLSLLLVRMKQRSAVGWMIWKDASKMQFETFERIAKVWNSIFPYLIWIGDESRILELSQSSRSLSFKKSQSEAKIDVSFSAALGSTDTSICKLCIRKFGKLSRRPYRCPYCRQSVCGDCSSRKAVIRGSKSPVRQQPVVKVCDTCHGLITGEVKPDDPILIQE